MKIGMLTYLVALGLLTMGSLPAFGAEIQHQDCNIYLPVGSDVSSWAGLLKKFQTKGYTTIEVESEKLPDLLDPDELVGQMTYTITSTHHNGAWFGNDNSCSVEMTVKKLIKKDEKGDLLFSTLHYNKSEQKSRGSTIKCGRAENSAFADIPQCKVKN